MQLTALKGNGSKSHEAKFPLGHKIARITFLHKSKKVQKK